MTHGQLLLWDSALRPFRQLEQQSFTFTPTPALRALAPELLGLARVTLHRDSVGESCTYKP